MKRSILLFCLVFLSLTVLISPIEVKVCDAGESGKDIQSQNQKPTKGQINVYDAKGQFLGYLVEMTETTVFVPSLQVMVRFDPGTGDIAWYPLFFESNDCSGNPYITPNYSYFLFKYGDDIYRGAHVAPADIVVHSGTAQDGVCKLLPQSVASLMVSAEKFGSKLPFSIPVSLPLEMIYK